MACLQPMKYWPEACELLIGQPELATDERFADYEGMAANSGEGAEILKAAIPEPRPPTSCGPSSRPSPASGPWVQTTLEVVEDPQAVANGYVSDCANSEGEAFQLVHRADPVRRGAGAARPARPTSTSTATPSSRGSASTWTRSST